MLVANAFYLLRLEIKLGRSKLEEIERGFRRATFGCDKHDLFRCLE